MMHKKDLAILLLAAALGMGSASFSSAERLEHKLRHSLNLKQQYKKHDYKDDFSPFRGLQERMRMTGKDYTIIKAPPDNMQIIVPNLSKYSSRVVVPDVRKYKMPFIPPKLDLRPRYDYPLFYKKFYDIYKVFDNII